MPGILFTKPVFTCLLPPSRNAEVSPSPLLSRGNKVPLLLQAFDNQLTLPKARACFCRTELSLMCPKQLAIE